MTLPVASERFQVFWKYRGHDHFVFFSITINQMVGIGVKTFFMTICQNCTVVTIETSPTNTAISGRTHKYWYAAPYPSSFHWWEGIKELPWTVSPVTTARRDILALFIGSVKTMNVNSNSLRRSLHTQCTADTGCQWFTTAHTCNGVSPLVLYLLDLQFVVVMFFIWMRCHLTKFVASQLRSTSYFIPPH